ncbi:MAG: hypothetical protein R6W76_13225, partial [Caldilinea sp.]
MSTSRRFLSNQPISRRHFLLYSGLSATALGFAACTSAVSLTAPAVPTSAPSLSTTNAALIEFTLTARKLDTSILPGKATQALGYASSV